MMNIHEASFPPNKRPSQILTSFSMFFPPKKSALDSEVFPVFGWRFSPPLRRSERAIVAWRLLLLDLREYGAA